MRAIGLFAIVGAVLLICSGSAIAADTWSREYGSYHAETWIDDTTPTTAHFGDSLLMYESSVGHAHRHIIIKWTVPALNAGEVLDSVVIVGTNRTTGGSMAYRMHRVLRNVVLSQATWNEYATGQSWATAGGTGTGDIDTSTNYSGAPNGIITEGTPSTYNDWPTQSVIARGSGLKVWAQTNLLGGSSTIIFDTLLITTASAMTIYSSYGSPVPALILYGHYAAATDSSTRRRIMSGE